MKTNLYTKTILTIIAICLVWICISMTSSAFADRDVIDVNIAKVPIPTLSNIHVYLTSWLITTNIRSIMTGADDEDLIEAGQKLNSFTQNLC